uniref:Thioredoxin-like_fold domain-containing protein n=1 Tax=Strongyloides papillosus TaxID=174720 RepID=A0A0N5BRA6_STREA
MFFYINIYLGRLLKQYVLILLYFMTLTSKLKLSVFYDIISPHCLPIFTELSNDVIFRNVNLDLKPVLAADMDLSYNSLPFHMSSPLDREIKFINALYDVNMIIPDNWNDLWLENKTENVQSFLANLISINKENKNDLIAFHLKLLRLFWIDNTTTIDSGTLISLVKSFTNLKSNFDLCNDREVKNNMEIAINENVIDIPFFILTAPKDCRYIYRGYESLPLIKNDITLQRDIN